MLNPLIQHRLMCVCTCACMCVRVLMCVCAHVPMCECAHASVFVWAWVWPCMNECAGIRGSQKRTLVPANGVMKDCCWDSNPGPVQEQDIFLTTGLPLQTPRLILHLWISQSAPLITSCTQCLHDHGFMKYFNTLSMCFSTSLLVNYSLFVFPCGLQNILISLEIVWLC